MNKFDLIQTEIEKMEGGAFQKLFDAYLYKKYGFTNIHELGVQAGTNKTTKGTPDSYVCNDDGTYILINYGNRKDSYKKIIQDINSCFDNKKIKIEKNKIAQIICGHGASNIHIDQIEEIKSLFDGVEIEIIGINTLSLDLLYKYPNLAKEHLGISIDTHQIFEIEDFICNYDKNKINAPLGGDFLFREKELNDVIDSIKNNELTAIIGPSGIGKTRLVLEACRRFENDGWKVFCIKSNGNNLYDDIRFYDSQENKLFFFDDANQVSDLKGVLDFIISSDKDNRVKVVFTVRDYAKQRALEEALKYVKPSVIGIKGFKEDEIKRIIKTNYQITNEEVLTRITKISKGNVRIAMLAGRKAKENNKLEINSIEELYKYYYGDVIANTHLSREQILFLFIVSLTGPIRKNSNDFYSNLTNRYLKDINIEMLVNSLYELELLDCFKDDIFNCSDQILGDYLVYFVLYEKKWVGIADLLITFFPQYKERIIYSLNTIMSVFNSEKIREYVIDQIKTAWDDANKDYEMEYAKSFFNADPVRALMVVREYIKNLEYCEYSITEEEIEKNKKTNFGINNIIELLSKFKYTELFAEAIELFFEFFEKRQDLFMDFYFAIKQNILYDKKSFYNHFEKENIFLKYLWEKCEEGKQEAYSLLYLNTIEELLKTEYEYVEGYTLHKRIIVFTNEIKDIRSNIWSSLFILREDGKYIRKVNSILMKRHISGLEKKATKDFIEFDFEQIYPYMEYEIDFVNAKVIHMYKKDAESVGLNIDDRMLRSNENEEFRVYNLLVEERNYKKNHRENEEIHRNKIREEIENYTNEEYKKLFTICKKLFDVEENSKWDMSSSIGIMFELKGKDKDAVNDLFKCLLESEILPTIQAIRVIIYCTIKALGYFETKDMIYSYTEKNQSFWLSGLFGTIPQEAINKDVVSDYKQFYIKNGEAIPRYSLLSKLIKFDKDLLDYIVKGICDDKKAAYFLEGCFSETDINELMEVFADKIDFLIDIYFLALGSNMDFEGKLFWELYCRKPEVWVNYIIWLEKHEHDFERNFIDRIWETEEFSERIEFAFGILASHDCEGFKLFKKTKNAYLNQRKLDWLFEQLQEYSHDLKKEKQLIRVVVNNFPEYKKEFIYEFLKKDNKIEDFREIDLFALHEEYSGSEIPLINEKIDFLYELESSLQGKSFLEHKNLINTKIRQFEKYKEEVEKREYIRNILNT